MKPLRRRPDSDALFGAPAGDERGARDGITIKDGTGMAKADKDGIYTLDGARFFIAAGDELPKGAVLDGAESSDAGEERALPGAPSNKARKAAPETKSA